MVDHLVLPDFVLAGKEGLAFFCPVPCLVMTSFFLYHTDSLATPRKCHQVHFGQRARRPPCH